MKRLNIKNLIINNKYLSVFKIFINIFRKIKNRISNIFFKKDNSKIINNLKIFKTLNSYFDAREIKKLESILGNHDYENDPIKFYKRKRLKIFY